MAVPPFPIPVPDNLAAALTLALALVIVWIVVSVPVYAAGKIVTAGKANLGQAMAATLGGGVTYLLVLLGGTIVLSMFVGALAFLFAFVLALIAWLAVYRASFDTGWLGTLGIVAVAWGIFFVLDVILVEALGIGFPQFYPF